MNELEPIADDLPNQWEWTELVQNIAGWLAGRKRIERRRNNRRSDWTSEQFLGLDIALIC